MRAREPEWWWGSMVLCLLGLLGEAVAAAKGIGGGVPLPCAVILAVTMIRLWRER